MQMILNQDTRWHDGPNEIIVPAGEVVWREVLAKVPKTEYRWMSQSIEHKKTFFKLRFVPIKIRDWWAIVDVTWLNSIDGKPIVEPAQKARQQTRKRLEMAIPT